MPYGARGWTCDMGLGAGRFTCYVRGYRAAGNKFLQCITKRSGRGNWHNVQCPRGYAVSGCEEMRVHGNGCVCDSGFGAGNNQCYSRCCKLHVKEPPAMAKKRAERKAKKTAERRHKYKRAFALARERKWKATHERAAKARSRERSVKRWRARRARRRLFERRQKARIAQRRARAKYLKKRERKWKRNKKESSQKAWARARRRERRAKERL